MEKRPAAVQSDLTQGSVWRQLVKYSAPLVLSSLLQAAYSLVDVMVVGHYVGPSAISAVNNASMVMNMLTQVIIGLTTGGNILIGQYFGKREMENCKKATVTLYVLTLILGVVVAAAMYFCSGPILDALDAPSYDEALIYLQWCSIGVFFIFGYNGIAAVLLDDESRMLSQTGLVHVLLVNIFGLLGSGVHRDVDGHPAVDSRVAEEVEHASFFVVGDLLEGLAALIGCGLVNGDVAQPRIPVPQYIAVLCAARYDERKW